MTTVGERLKKERELRDISIEDIAKFTKILPVFIDNLESDNFDSLPAGVFTRGFIRAYCQFIGIDGEDMVNLYLQQVEAVESDSVEENPQKEENIGGDNQLILFATISVVLVVVIILAIYFSNRTVPDDNNAAEINIEAKIPAVQKEEKSSEPVIDNYIDDSVLTLFSKRKKNVSLLILTMKITKQMELDVKKFNDQFPPVELKQFEASHDRFLMIDEKEIYHFGASLKDLGKKWFAFSRMDVGIKDIFDKVEGNNEK